MATPAAAADTGTPESIRAKDPPHTLAIDEEPNEQYKKQV